jgi:hypothetical protein
MAKTHRNSRKDNKKKTPGKKELNKKKGGSDTEFMKHMMTFIQQISSLACDSASCMFPCNSACNGPMYPVLATLVMLVNMITIYPFQSFTDSLLINVQDYCASLENGEKAGGADARLSSQLFDEAEMKKYIGISDLLQRILLLFLADIAMEVNAINRSMAKKVMNTMSVSLKSQWRTSGPPSFAGLKGQPMATPKGAPITADDALLFQNAIDLIISSNQGNIPSLPLTKSAGGISLKKLALWGVALFAVGTSINSEVSLRTPTDQMVTASGRVDLQQVGKVAQGLSDVALGHVNYVSETLFSGGENDFVYYKPRFLPYIGSETVTVRCGRNACAEQQQVLKADILLGFIGNQPLVTDGGEHISLRPAIEWTNRYITPEISGIGAWSGISPDIFRTYKGLFQKDPDDTIPGSETEMTYGEVQSKIQAMYPGIRFLEDDDHDHRD